MWSAVSAKSAFPALHDDPFAAGYIHAVQDTLPPIQDRQGDFINEANQNPFDLKDPKIVEQNVDFDPETGQYIITEKIGDDYFRPPTYMTFDEYLAWRKKQEEDAYFDQLAGVNRGSGVSSLDPLAKFDVKSSLIDRLFGGTTVDIRPQGGIDLTFGVDHQRLDNPILTERQRRQTVFDFDMNIQMNVTGKIGEKLTLTTNYNNNATFNFDNQIKLNYNSDLFSEDDIIKKIEAGNVSLPLRGTLIQGAQSLFGLKTELQFGHLRLTTIVSQQQSQRENIQIQGGSQLQKFEVKSDEYDENRHFFLSHYNRESYESALRNLPQINTLFQLENLEVWITNDRNEVQDVRDIVALADLGEPQRIVNPNAVNTYDPPRFREIGGGKPLPENYANDLYAKIIAQPDIRDIDQSVAVLQSQQFGLVQSRDFEKVRARKLKSTEYTVHPELGFISVNINVQPDQVLAVGYQYKYNGKIYKVGELSVNTGDVSTDTSRQISQVLFVKLLKSMTQRTDVPTWDLMMKNVYSIGAYQVNPQDFRLDIFYEDPGKGVKRFLPKGNLEGVPLIRVFNLDRLNTQGDPQPDGVFDFVPGVTINPVNGRIYFPVLEPFGSAIGNQITDPALRDTFTYPELYSKTIFLAREFPEKNRFSIRGSYKSSVSSEISLGAFNIPPGSVRVTAGGQMLQEGRDYEVDYSTGRLRILNDAVLASGVPINVSFEDNTLFGFQQKTMFGIRADYEVSKNFSVGATFLQLFERPFTPKVNMGEDPINNRIFGGDINFSKESQFLTKLVDKLPFYSTKQPSTISVSAEAAYLDPGHARAINQSNKDKGGVVYVDDFEGSTNSIDLRVPANQWVLASVPQNDDQNNNPLFPESRANNLSSGANRARINWYRIDPSARGPNDDNNPYTSLVPQQEVFPNLQLTPDQLSPNIQPFDMVFFPNERGPYNFDTPNGYAGLSRGVSVNGDSLVLRDPETRWGGIMRAMTTNDFQSANIEFVEFWMLSPFLDTTNAFNPAPDAEDKQGTLYLNLGNVSEDILKDSRQFFEHGLPSDINPDREVDSTLWSVVPRRVPYTRAFDNSPGTREVQDVGLDGLNDEGERRKFGSWVNAIRAINPQVGDKVATDPANDNFRYYRHSSFGSADGIKQRYRDFNNPQGNSQSNTGNLERQSGTNTPDMEDLNQDFSLNESESYFQYEIPLYVDPFNRREVDRSRTPFITDRIEAGNGRIWYRFRIPLNTPNKKSVGGILDFRSILFMRMYMRGFKTETYLRFARLELVRNQWRRYTQDLTGRDINGVPDNCNGVETNFEIDAVNIEENSSRLPFNYTLPQGIQRERSLGVFQALQNEQSLSLRLNGLCDGDARAVFKITEADMRVYDKLQMFVHAEAPDRDVPDGGLRVFMRLGSDFQNNYYEYEIPLTMSNPDAVTGLPPSDPRYKQEVWRVENEFNFQLKLLRQLKEERNQTGGSATAEYVRVLDPSNPALSHVIKVKGNPNLGYVKVAMIGVRNPYTGDGASYRAEVWANELRLSGLDERGGVAAIARVDMQLADLGNVTLAGNFNSIGFGALDDRVHERSRESVTGYDLAANVELNKFLPEKWNIKIPFYAQRSNTTRTPEFDPYDLDVILRDKLKAADSPQERDSLRVQAQEVTNITTFNFTNVRKERGGGGGGTGTGGGGGGGGGAGGGGKPSAPKPWDIENFSASYGYTETDRRDAIIEFDRQKRYTGGINYTYTRPAKYIEPFKKVIKDDKYLKLIKELNLNPLPNTLTFSTLMDRSFTTTRYRFAGVDERFNTFFNKRFTWDRDYTLQWDLTRSLKVSFNANNNAVIDEPDEVAMLEDPNIGDIRKFRRDSIWNNIRDLGRPKLYKHDINISYNLPLRLLPFMDWIQIRAQYQAGYAWNAAALNVDSLGNVIQNRQTRSINADLSFDKLYDQIGYLKKINRGAAPKGKGKEKPGAKSDDKGQEIDAGGDKDSKDKKTAKKKDTEPSVAERILIRPLLLLRKARVTYTEQFRTVVPGFMPRSNILGMESGFGAPGWDFVAGMQPTIRTLREPDYYQEDRDWLYRNRNWLTTSLYLNQDVVQDYSQTYDGRLTLEPFRDFRVEIEANKTYTENHTETFKDTTSNGIVDYAHAVPTQMGSMTVTYSALQTLFQDSRQEIIDLFRTFEANQLILSQRLGTGLHTDPNLGQLGYTDGYGKNQQDIMIPAFIAAYTKQDARSINLDLFKTLPKLNWRLTYNGLSKIPLFKNIFSNFNISHAYKSTMTINSYRTGLDYLANRSNGSRDTLSGNFFARLEIPEIVIQEAFSPLIAVEATLQNGISFNADYKKSRNLALSTVNRLLAETQTKEITIGFGYLLRNVDIPFLTGSKKKGAKKPKQDEKEQKPDQNQNRNQQGGRSGQLQGRDLDIQCNFSIRDDVTLAHKLDDSPAEPTRGNYALSLSPSAEYKLNKRLSLRLFFDYRRTVPKTSSGFPRTDASGGLVVRFQLN